MNLKVPMQDDPEAYEYFLDQEYDKMRESLAKDPSQAKAVFGVLETTLLHKVAHDDHAHLLDLLIELGADVAACEVNGWTPLHVAAIYSHPQAASRLLDAGAAINAVDGEGFTPLQRARISRALPQLRVQCVELLLSRGASE